MPLPNLLIDSSLPVERLVSDGFIAEKVLVAHPKILSILIFNKTVEVQMNN